MAREPAQNNACGPLKKWLDTPQIQRIKIWDKGICKQYELRSQQTDIRVADDCVVLSWNTMEYGLLEFGETCCPSPDTQHAAQSENVVTTGPSVRCYGQQDQNLQPPSSNLRQQFPPKCHYPNSVTPRWTRCTVISIASLYPLRRSISSVIRPSGSQ